MSGGILTDWLQGHFPSPLQSLLRRFQLFKSEQRGIARWAAGGHAVGEVPLSTSTCQFNC